MDAINLAAAVQEIVASGFSPTIATLASIVVLTWAMLRCTLRETSPAVWILAADFYYVDIDLVESARQI
jgi:hypothetical protein